MKSNNSIPAIWIGSNNEFKDCRNIDPREFQLNKEQRDMVGALEDIIGFSITTDLLLGRDQGRGLSIPNPPVDENFNMEIDSDYLKKIVDILSEIVDTTISFDFKENELILRGIDPSRISLFQIVFNTDELLTYEFDEFELKSDDFDDF